MMIVFNVSERQNTGTTCDFGAAIKQLSEEGPNGFPGAVLFSSPEKYSGEITGSGNCAF